MKTPKQRFQVVEFKNPRTNSTSWRVSGTKRDGSRIRENYTDASDALKRQVALESEWHAKETDTELRATRLTDAQVGIAEAAFKLVDNDQDVLTGLQYWLRVGRLNVVAESPRMADAFAQFAAWVQESSFRPCTKSTLATRLKMFIGGIPNLKVCDCQPEHIEKYLENRNVSAVTKGNDRRAISRFFEWCLQRPRHWTQNNPVRAIANEDQGEESVPTVLTVDECRRLLDAAQAHRKGKAVPYIAACLFAGLRPFEAARLRWEQVNLSDGEIRLEATQTKTKRSRMVSVCNALKAWLEAYQGMPFRPPGLEKDLLAIKRKAGFGRPTDAEPELKPLPQDVMRHTAISHFFRNCESYGRTAEQFGNSEKIIREHYQGRVSSADTKQFYDLFPPQAKRRGSKIVKLDKPRRAGTQNIVALKGGSA